MNIEVAVQVNPIVALRSLLVLLVLVLLGGPPPLPNDESEYIRPLGNEQPSEGGPSGCQGEESPSGTSGEPVPSPYTLLDIFEGSVSPVAIWGVILRCAGIFGWSMSGFGVV